jgi:hypothetical protein
MFVRQIVNFKSIMLAGLILNVAMTVYVYFLVDGGPASLKQGGDWVAILNEIPMVVLFYLAGVLKPYVMVWSNCRNNPGIVFAAGVAMFATSAIAALVIFVATTPLVKDITLYSNWAFLWGTSAYYVLTRHRRPTNE